MRFLCTNGPPFHRPLRAASEVVLARGMLTEVRTDCFAFSAHHSGSCVQPDRHSWSSLHHAEARNLGHCLLLLRLIPRAKVHGPSPCYIAVVHPQRARLSPQTLPANCTYIHPLDPHPGPSSSPNLHHSSHALSLKPWSLPSTSSLASVVPPSARIRTTIRKLGRSHGPTTSPTSSPKAPRETTSEPPCFFPPTPANRRPLASKSQPTLCGK